jgi:acyl-homoserine-lactone acylase
MLRLSAVLAVSAALLAAAPAPVLADQDSARTFTPHGEIIWDNYGIPHIYGQTVEDVLYGYGFAHMENHAETILRKVATARGRLAEYFGAGDQNSNIASDTQIRTFDIPNRSVRWLAEGTEEQRRFLTIFCAGQNAYAQQNASTIDPSLQQVLPIVPTDVLDIAQNTIHFTFMLEQWDLQDAVTAWQQGLPPPPVSAGARAATNGSNGWALAPRKSANGRAILMGNPHLPWGVNQPVPNLDIYQWFEAQLVVGDPDNPTLNASGVAFTGAPFIGIGFSDDIGWTHTNDTIKNADLYDIAPSGPGQYLFDGKTLALSLRQDQIKVLQTGGSFVTVPITIASSIQGPIIAQRADGHVLALRVAGLDGNSITSEYWGMIRAHNLGEFIAANSSLQMPFFNVIYADRNGDIMYLFGGKQPVRNGGTFADYLGILDGNTSQTLWTETLPWQALPKTIDPPGGFVANSNDPPWTSTFPLAISPAAFPAWISPVEMTLRPQHGATYLLSKPTLTPADVIAGKESTEMFLADRLLGDLIAAAIASGDPTAKQAAAVLSAWDRTADAASKGGPLFEAWYNIYLADPNTPRSPVFGSAYPAFRIEWSLDKALTTPVGLADPAGAVPALITAANQLQAAFGAVNVDWGTSHRVVLVTHDGTFTQTIPLTNAPQSGTTDVFGPIRVIDSFTEGPLSLGYGGDSYVQVVQFDPFGPATAQALVGYGNASRPGSPHITDQLAVFEAKTLRPSLRQRAEVLANAVSTEKY